MSAQDDYGYFGPSYSFADNIKLPGQIGVRQEPTFGAIIDSVAGINYYLDTIAFGGRTFFDQQETKPMGIRYFLNTGMRCSNGASMSEYFDGITKGDLLGDHVAQGLASSGLPGLKGLAPGIAENARDALDPRPIFAAVTATGYPVCQEVTCPVGDAYGSIQNALDASSPYIVDPVQYVAGGGPTQTRWVQAYDSGGSPINITKDEFGASPKCYNADGSYMDKPPAGCPLAEPTEVNAPGAGKFGLCTMVRPATMPPTLNPGGGSEGFADSDGRHAETMLVGACAIALLGVGLWYSCRK